MNYTVEFTPAFYDDLENIKSYIAKDDLNRANNFVRELSYSAESLSLFPLSHRPLQELFKRELPKAYKYMITNGYYIIYEVIQSVVRIHRAISCKQDIMQFIEFTIS